MLCRIVLIPTVADAGVLPVVFATLGAGGISAFVTAVVAFRRMRVQNTVDVRTIAAREAEILFTAQSAVIDRQGAEIERQAQVIRRQGAEIVRLRGVIQRCEERLDTVELRRRNE